MISSSRTGRRSLDSTLRPRPGRRTKAEVSAAHPRVHWTTADIPSQAGRTAVVTGANSGIGFETARVLAQRAAGVVLACRDDERAADAVARIGAESADSAVETLRLDLASLASVREAAAALRS